MLSSAKTPVAALPSYSMPVASAQINTDTEKIKRPAIQPVEQATSGKNTSYGVTLGNIKGLKNNAKEKLEAVNKNREALTITNDNLAASWKMIVDEMTTEKVIYRNAIGQGSITFEENKISINVFGVAYDFLKNQRLKLLDYFKNYYQNEQINVMIIEKVPDADKMIEQVLSTKEIFEKMASQNPLLKKLKDNLGMDFEY